MHGLASRRSPRSCVFITGSIYLYGVRADDTVTWLVERKPSERETGTCSKSTGGAPEDADGVGRNPGTKVRLRSCEMWRALLMGELKAKILFEIFQESEQKEVVARKGFEPL